MESKVNETNQESRPKMSIYDEAVSCISSDELESLYGIFLYYNSAMEGDSLPSINFSRFHVFLKDASIMKLKFDLDLVRLLHFLNFYRVCLGTNHIFQGSNY